MICKLSFSLIYYLMNFDLGVDLHEAGFPLHRLTDTPNNWLYLNYNIDGELNSKSSILFGNFGASLHVLQFSENAGF